MGIHLKLGIHCLERWTQCSLLHLFTDLLVPLNSIGLNSNYQL